MKKQLMVVVSALAFATVAQGIPQLRLDLRDKETEVVAAPLFEEIDSFVKALNSKGISLYDLFDEDWGRREFDLKISDWEDTYASILKFYNKPGGYDRPSKDPGATRAVPDGGATAILLGTALAGIGIVRRYLRA